MTASESKEIGTLPLHYALLKVVKLHAGISVKSGARFPWESVFSKLTVQHYSHNKSHLYPLSNGQQVVALNVSKKCETTTCLSNLPRDRENTVCPSCSFLVELCKGSHSAPLQGFLPEPILDP